jgi:hypothetical protein
VLFATISIYSMHLPKELFEFSQGTSSVNTLPSLLDCSRFKEIGDFTNNVLSDCGLPHSSYVNIDDFNQMCEKYSNGFLCINHNCRKLLPKLDMFINTLSEFKVKPAILSFTETWLTTDDANLANLPGYNLYSVERQNRVGGGVCAFVSNEFTVFDVQSGLHDTFENIDIFIKLSDDRILVICVVYRPPDSKIADFLIEFNNYLMTHTGSTHPLLICGDFNINLLNVDSVNSVAEFVDLIYSNSLLPVIHNPTRITSHSATLIDNIFVGNLFPSVSGILCADFSDHLPIFAIFDDLHMSKKPSSCMAEFNGAAKYINYKKVCENLGSANWNFITDSSDVNTDYNNFINVTRIAVDTSTQTHNALNASCHKNSPG